MTSTARVHAAIVRTREKVPTYWSGCLAQRSAGSPTAAGSVYDLAPAQIEAALLGASWEPYAHRNVAAGCVAFEAPIQGLVGLMLLTNLDEEAEVTLADPKATGFVEATVRATWWTSIHTIIILGNNEGSEVVFTFHPGPPIQPSRIPAEGNVGRVVTAAQAVEMGLVWAKVAS